MCSSSDQSMVNWCCCSTWVKSSGLVWVMYSWALPVKHNLLASLQTVATSTGYDRPSSLIPCQWKNIVLALSRIGPCLIILRGLYATLVVHSKNQPPMVGADTQAPNCLFKVCKWPKFSMTMSVDYQHSQSMASSFIVCGHLNSNSTGLLPNQQCRRTWSPNPLQMSERCNTFKYMEYLCKIPYCGCWIPFCRKILTSSIWFMHCKGKLGISSCRWMFMGEI